MPCSTAGQVTIAHGIAEPAGLRPLVTRREDVSCFTSPLGLENVNAGARAIDYNYR
jgi:hypothetical protein